MKRHVSSYKIICWRFTKKCNRSCNFCLAKSGPKQNNPTWDINKVINRLVNLGVEKISYAGGEPFLHPQLESAIKLGSRLGATQIVTTNGDYLYNNHLDWLYLMEYLKISFYGLEKNHDKIMGTGHFSKLLKLTKTLIKKYNISVGFNYMLTHDSLKELPDFLREAQRIGVKQILILSYIKTGLCSIDNEYEFKAKINFESILNKLSQALLESFPGGVKIHNFAEQRFYIVLDEKGNLTMPGANRDDSFILGNLYDNFLRMPNSQLTPSLNAIHAIFNKRLNTKAIIT